MSGQFKSLSDFQKSNLINYGYGVADLKSDKKNIVFSFSPGFKIFGNFNSLDELKINIFTKLKPIDGNADEVNENRYTWIINKDNNDDKSIYLILTKNKELNEKELKNNITSKSVASRKVIKSDDSIENLSISTILIIILVLLTIVVLIVFIIKYIIRKNNMI